MATKSEALPTQKFIDIAAIEHDLARLKNGGLRKVLLVSGVNVALKSEEEQEIITYAFQGFLNSLDFPVQIVIHSRKLNIDEYLSRLEQRELQEENELLKNQIVEYREFIKTFVTQNAIMQKRFFMVVPYDPIQVPQAGLNIVDKLLTLLKLKPAADAKKEKERKLEEILTQLDQRVDQIINGLNQVGLRAVPLNNSELVELFYNFYNPASIEKKGGIEITKTT